jgi:hypothetical protein
MHEGIENDPAFERYKGKQRKERLRNLDSYQVLNDSQHGKKRRCYQATLRRLSEILPVNGYEISTHALSPSDSL